MWNLERIERILIKFLLINLSINLSLRFWLWLYIFNFDSRAENDWVAQEHFIFVRDTHDMKIMPVIPGQIRCDTHLSLFDADPCTLIKRRFVLHGSCANAIFPRRLFEPTPALVAYIYVNLTMSGRNRTWTQYRKVRVSDFVSQSRFATSIQRATATSIVPFCANALSASLFGFTHSRSDSRDWHEKFSREEKRMKDGASFHE